MLIKMDFINKIHNIFNKIDYITNDIPSVDIFLNKVGIYISYTNDLYDSAEIISLASYCILNWKRIELIFKRHIDVWKKIIWIKNINNKIRRNDIIFASNGLTKNVNDIYLFNYNNEIFKIFFSRNKFRLNKDSNLELSYSVNTPDIVKIYYKNKKLVSLMLTDDYKLLLTDNNSPFEIDIRNNCENIYYKDYYDSIKNGESFNTSNRIAIIEFTSLNNDSYYGIAKNTFLKEISEYEKELLLLFSIVKLKLYQLLEIKMEEEINDIEEELEFSLIEEYLDEEDDD